MSNISFSNAERVSPKGIQQLRESIGWKPGKIEVWDNAIKTALHVSSAWDGDTMVGVAFLVGNHRHGILCDLVVHPEYQGKGIGRRLAKELVAQAQDLNLIFLNLTYDPERPWLKNFYSSLGFKSVNNAMQINANHRPQER